MRKVQKAHGRAFLNPPILNISCSLSRARMIAPALKNRSALKQAWVMKWKIAADHAPTPRARNIYPIWLMVE